MDPTHRLRCFHLSLSPGLIAALIVSFAGIGGAQPTGSISEATSAGDMPEPIAEIFDQNCRECHHPDTADEHPYLHSGMRLADLMDGESIVPGDPSASMVVERVMLAEDQRRRMPRSKGVPGDQSYRAPLSEQEKTRLADWGRGLGSAGMELPGPGGGVSSEEAGEDLPAPTEATLASASQDDDDLPEGTLEVRARHILSRHCQRCHNPERRTSPDLRAPLHAILRSGDGDEILARVHLPPGDDNVMPPEPNRRLREEETRVLEQWFASADEEVEARDPILFSETLRAIHEDVVALGSAARYHRYFTLTNLHNATNSDGLPVYSALSLDTFRAGLSKLMNSLSLHGEIAVPVALDEERTVYRIDLRNYRWSPEDWERVVRYYPHGIIGVDSRRERIIAQGTGSRMAYLRADWFAFAAAQPPLYDDILDYLLGIYAPGDAGVQQRLESRIGVGRVGNIRRGEAIRAGFLDSGVSDHNRLIERHESDFGGYWVSYDFKRLGGGPRQDLRMAPMGPAEAAISSSPERVFEHDGGEMIYALPNGLQAYLLATADGTRLDRAPNDIVRDANRPDGTIINGISCIACHDRGIKGAIRAPYPEGIVQWDEEVMGEPNPRSPAGMTDEIRPFVEGASILGGRELGLFRKLYPERDVLRRHVLLDYERFREADEKATGGFQGEMEPVSALYDSYYLEPVNSHLLSAEFGMDHGEMMGLLETASFDSEGFRTLYHSLASGSAEARDQMLQEYLTIVYHLGYQLMPFEPLGYEEFGGRAFADLIRESPAYLALFGDGYDALAQSYDEVVQGYAAAKGAITQSQFALDRQSRATALLPGGGRITVEVDPVIPVGERGHLRVTSDRTVYLHVLHRGSGTDVTQFFPNASLRNNRIVPEEGRAVTKTINFRTSPPAGAEYFEVYVSEAPIRVKIQGIPVGDFTSFDKSRFFNSRGIATALSASDSQAAKSEIPPSLTKVKVGYLLRE